MANTHTPGPWAASDKSISFGGFDKSPTQGGLVAANIEDMFGEAIEKADLVLMAAGPELVQACRDLLGRIERDAPGLRDTQEASSARSLLLRVAPANTGVDAIDRLFDSGCTDFTGFSK